MKAVFILTSMFLLFACTENRSTGHNRATSKSCACDKRQDSDSIFFATDVLLQESAGKKIISYSCADIATAIASVSSVNEAEQCENLYELQCVSTTKNSLVLSDSFTYFSEEMAAMDLTGAGAQNLFFEALKSKPKAYFEFTVVNKAIRAVTKIKM